MMNNVINSSGLFPWCKDSDSRAAAFLFLSVPACCGRLFPVISCCGTQKGCTFAVEKKGGRYHDIQNQTIRQNGTRTTLLPRHRPGIGMAEVPPMDNAAPHTIRTAPAERLHRPPAHVHTATGDDHH